jgi:hypothetical protein
MKGHYITYSSEELNWIKAHCTAPRRQMHMEFQRRFGRSDVSLVHIHALCNRKGWFTGRTGQFRKGLIPHNAGVPQELWLKDPSKCRARQFKKGHEPHNTKWEGHERLSRDGYLEMSVGETNPHTGYARRYVLKHKWLWEKKNGPVPKGHALKCLDGNKLNTDPKNWIAVPRGLLPRLAGIWTLGYDEAPAELKPIVLTVAKLKHKAMQARK